MELIQTGTQKLIVNIIIIFVFIYLIFILQEDVKQMKAEIISVQKEKKNAHKEN